LVAYLVVAVATGSVTACLYNTMNERRREFAILRSLGARRRTVFAVIVCESSAIAVAGGVLGLVVHGAIMAAAASLVRAQTGVVIAVFEPHPVLVLAPLGLIALGALAGVVPALKAYRTDVATHLAPTS
jgi:putative ABC transport system permease protein